MLILLFNHHEPVISIYETFHSYFSGILLPDIQKAFPSNILLMISYLHHTDVHFHREFEIPIALMLNLKESLKKLGNYLFVSSFLLFNGLAIRG